jgi:hypothetical protein
MIRIQRGYALEILDSIEEARAICCDMKIDLAIDAVPMLNLMGMQHEHDTIPPYHVRTKRSIVGQSQMSTFETVAGVSIENALLHLYMYI